MKLKHVLSAGLCAALAAAVLCGCGAAASGAASSGAGAASSAAASASAAASGAVSAAASGEDLSSCVSDILAANPISNPRDVTDNDLYLDYALPKEDVVAYSGKISNDQGNAGLVLVIQCASGKAGDVVKALDAYRTAALQDGSMNYAEFADAQTSVENGIIEQYGDCAVMVFASGDGDGDYTPISDAVSAAFAE